jgi:hypothetical protein
MEYMVYTLGLPIYTHIESIISTKVNSHHSFLNEF